MVRVKTDFQHLAVPEKILRAGAIVEAMDGNAHFPTPTPALQEVRTFIQALENAYQDAYYGGSLQKSVMNICVKNLDTAIVGLSGYVQAASAGDAAIILSSGFEPRSVQSGAKQMVAPNPPVAKSGPREGEVKLTWNPIDGARTYTVQVSHDNGETWEAAGTFTKTRVVIPGLPAGTRPYFRVSAFGTQGDGGWSESGMGKVTGGS